MATLQQAIDNLVTATSTANDVINQAKAVNTNATNHKTDPAAHSELFAKPAPDVALSDGIRDRRRSVRDRRAVLRLHNRGRVELAHRGNGRHAARQQLLDVCRAGDASFQR